MPDPSEKPSAAGTPESGTGITMSAWTQASCASCRPSAFRVMYTVFPLKILLSGLAK